MQNERTIIGIFEDRSHAQNAVRELKQAGFTEREIGATARDGDPETSARRIQGEDETHAKEGAVTGLAAGAGVGALWGLGVLAGVVPAIGPAIAGGTLAALLSSAAAGAATAGLAGTLIGLGIPEDEARYYDEEFRSGRTLVSVQADGRMEEARSILQRCGGYDMRSQQTHDEARAAGTLADRRTLEAREEELQVRKRPVQTGEAEVRKEVRTEQRTLEVPIEKEELVIERHAVGRRPAADGIDGNGDETIRVPLSEERVEVQKKPVVTEEVTVGKRKTRGSAHVAANVRKEKIKVKKASA